MSDAMLDRIQAQCRSFIQDPDSNYMLSIFAQKLDVLEALSDADKSHLNQVHRQILICKVIPAYQTLINGLEAFRGTGRESCGLSHYPGGTDYYCYLLKSQTGVYEPIARIRKRLLIHFLLTMPKEPISPLWHPKRPCFFFRTVCKRISPPWAKHPIRYAMYINPWKNT